MPHLSDGCIKGTLPSYYLSEDVRNCDCPEGTETQGTVELDTTCKEDIETKAEGKVPWANKLGVFGWKEIYCYLNDAYQYKCEWEQDLIVIERDPQLLEALIFMIEELMHLCNTFSKLHISHLIAIYDFRFATFVFFSFF